MSQNYIDINSAYRNRDQFPDVADFTVPFGTFGGGSPYTDSHYAEAFPVYDFYTGLLNTASTFSTSDGFTPSVNYFQVPFINPYANIEAATLYNGYNLERLDTFQRSMITYFSSPTATSNLVTPIANDAVPIVPFTTPANLYDISPFANVYPYTGSLNPAETNGINLQYADLYYRIPFSAVNVFQNYYVVAEDAPPGKPIYSVIQRYFPDVRTIVTSPRFPPAIAASNMRWTLRKKLPIQKNYTVVGSPSRNKVVITPVAGFSDKDYVDKMVYFPPAVDPFGTLGIPVDDPAILPNVTINRMTFPEFAYRIQAFDAATNTITLDRSINETLYNQSGPAYQTFVGRKYEILPLPVSTTCPLLYSGSTVSQSNDVCYEIALLNIMLPNVTLATGSRIVDYPFVFIELSTDGDVSTVGQNVITSNNPNAAHALFVCAVTNVVDPDASTFIRIDASGMRQTIKFRPNSSMRFKVYLPDGSLFQPALADSPSPLPPNNLLQIEAIFEISR